MLILIISLSVIVKTVLSAMLQPAVFAVSGASAAVAVTVLPSDLCVHPGVFKPVPRIPPTPFLYLPAVVWATFPEPFEHGVFPPCTEEVFQKTHISFLLSAIKITPCPWFYPKAERFVCYSITDTV